MRRYVSEPQAAYRSGAQSIWAGGVSADPGSPFYANLLRFWLVNEALPLTLRTKDVDGQETELTPPKKKGKKN